MTAEKKDPLLIDLPMPIVTKRILLRPPAAGDGQTIHNAKRESWDDLSRWMIWTQKPLDELTAEDDEIFCRHKQALFYARKDMTLLIFEKGSGQYLGGCGLHKPDWQSRIFTVGYWVRSSRSGEGLATEAATAMVHYAFKVLGAQKVNTFYAEGNEASRRVMEKTGVQKEGVKRHQHLLPDGQLVDEHLYGLINLGGVPDIQVSWG